MYAKRPFGVSACLACRVALRRDRRCTFGKLSFADYAAQLFILDPPCSRFMDVQRRSRRSATLPRPTRRHADRNGRRFQLLTGILEIDCRLLMPKPIARRKTKKAVAKRFKVTATGKVLRGHAGRRHLLVSKNAKRKRQLAKSAVLDKTDEARIKENLPFN
jgi:large subunit ribosomal protein L35